MSKDLRQFLKTVKEAGPDFYVEVNRPLKPYLEPFILQQKLAKEGRYPVLYCPEIEGSKLPLVTNLFGSWEMLGLILGVEPERIQRLGQIELFWEYRRKMASGMVPNEEVPASKAPVKEVILKGKDVDLGLLPITHHAVLDSGKYIIIGGMICKDPETGIPNVGVYRHELKGKDLLGMSIGEGQHGMYIARKYLELKRPMEVVIAIGHHPAVLFAFNTRGPLDMNELELAGSLLGEPLRVTTAETVDLPVPADAEVIIEAVIDPPSKVSTDGPFAEYTGYYGEGKHPVFLLQVKAITMRRDAIWHDLDPAHKEHNFLWSLLARESNTFDVVKRAVPSVKAVHGGTPGLGGSPIMYVSIKKQFEGEGKLAGLAALSTDMYINMVVVVDEDVDVYDEQEVWWAIGNRVRADHDISIIPGSLGSTLAPYAYNEAGIMRGYMDSLGYMESKVIIDATIPVNLPFATRITPSPELWKSMNLEDYLR